MQKIVIEFFSGSKNVSTVFEKNGWHSFTVDINPKLHPSMCADICTLQPALLPQNPSFLWLSPDCTTFSRTGNPKHWQKITNKYRNYTYIPVTPEATKAIQMVNASISIIQYFAGVPFVLENPIGRIHHTEAMRSLGHYRYAVNYADFGFPYSKETYLFSNFWLPFSTKKVSSKAPGLLSVHSRFQRSIVPPILVQKIIDYSPQ